MRDVGFLDPRQGPACDDALRMAIFDAVPGRCSMDSGYSFWVIQAPPTAEQLPAICRSSNCQKVVEVARKTSPNECVMFDGFFLYEDILSPIIKQCGGAPAPPPITTPAPTTAAPVSTGERPVDQTWISPTSTPSSRLTVSPVYSSDNVANSPSTGNAANSSWSTSSDSGTPFGLIFGCGVGVIVLIALIMWVRQRRKRDPDVQRRKRDPDVQRHQQLVYGREGAFDTMIEPSEPAPAAVYMALEAGDYARPSTDKPLSATKSVSESDKTYYSTNLGSVETTKQQPSLFQDTQIVAVRVPMDKITIGERLSSGGFGEVYKGTYKSQLVAIKKMLPEHRRDARLVEKFLAEVKLMASLEHERIVQFMGVAWESAADVCVLCEFMDGGDLRSMLKRLDSQNKPIGFDRGKIKIALHVAHALTYMHSLQPVVLHRDLKSSNILLSQDMDAKITDFGVSRERGDATMTRGVGTSLWMAPEIMMGGRYDEKADVFSFGVVLSELDSNKLPYANQVDLKDPKTNYMELMHDVSAGRLTVDFSYESDPEIVALGRSCVAVDPQERPSAAEALHRVHQVLRQHDGFA